MTKLQDSAMLCSLHVQSWTGKKANKQVASEAAEKHNAAQDAVSATVQLIPKFYLRPIQMVDAELRRQHERLTLPWLNDGTRILSTALFFEHTEAIVPLLRQREQLVEEFARNLPAMKERAKLDLGELYDDAAFPDEEGVKERFVAKVRHLPFPAAEDFRVNISEDVADSIRASITEDVQAQIDANVVGLRDKIADTLNDFIDRIKDYRQVEDDTKRAGYRTENPFRDTVVDGIKDLAKLLPGLNLTNDPEVNLMAQEIAEKLSWLEAEDLRSNEVNRNKAIREAKELVRKIKA